MFAEAFHSTIKDTHLTLEVKTSFDTLCLRRSPVRNPALRSLDFPLQSSMDSPEEERRRNLHTKSYKA
jgi:hypothetical protein